MAGYRQLLWLLAVLLACFLLPGQVKSAQPADEPESHGSLLIQTPGEQVQTSGLSARIYGPPPETLITQTPLNTPVSLPPGSYRVELDILGGTVSRERVLIRSGRTSTVILSEVAALQVNVLDKRGQDIGLGVEVYDGVSNQLLGEFLSGEIILAQPGLVDIKVAVPPQSQWWRDIELLRGGLRELTLRERVQGELLVHPRLAGKDVSPLTQVIIYAAGTQKEIARSEPGQEHRFSLETGSYDVFVANPTGRGKPFVLERTELPDEKTVEKDVHLDEQPDPPAAQPPTHSEPRAL
ncbi:MAG: hypothetical protein OXC18_06485 [Desulfurellaceae bacterium]|nr:hypothetical protein [Desulfurellaceae bacterium]